MNAPRLVTTSQAREEPWYMNRRTFRDRKDLRDAAKVIDENLKFEHEQLSELAQKAKSYTFPRMDYGRVTWDTTWNKYRPNRWTYFSPEKAEREEDEGYILPASNLSLPDDTDVDVPHHVASMFSIAALDDIDEGFELFGGIEHKTKIYFVEGAFSGLIKIGIASNLDSRLASLQSGCTELLLLVCDVPGNKHLEKFLHGLFEPLRSHGEWFRPHWTITSMIMGLSG